MSNTIFPAVYARNSANSSCCFEKKKYIIDWHKNFNNNTLGAKTKIRIIDSHRAYPYYDKAQDTIVIDTHFFDHLRMVTAVLISGKPEYMDILADACAADYFLCKDEVFLALEYAKSFCARKEKLEYQIYMLSDVLNKLFCRQVLFVLGHEQGHALIDANNQDTSFSPYRIHFNRELKQINADAKSISALDISLLKEDLDKINIAVLEEQFDYSNGGIAELLHYGNQLLGVVRKGVEILDVPKSDTLSKEEIVYYACDQYIKGTRIKLLEREQYETECIVDGYALQRLVSCQIGDEDVITRMKESVFAYYSCILTMNIITCVNSCVMNFRMEAYKDEDLVWNRLRLGRRIFNEVVTQFAYRKPNGFLIAEGIFQFASQLVNRYNIFYARFCDRVFTIQQPTDNTPYCPCGSKEYKEIYDMVCSHLATNLEYSSVN